MDPLKACSIVEISFNEQVCVVDLMKACIGNSTNCKCRLEKTSRFTECNLQRNSPNGFKGGHVSKKISSTEIKLRVADKQRTVIKLI